MQSYYQQANDSRFFGKDLTNFANSQTIGLDMKLPVKNINIDKSSFISNDDNTISQLSTQNSEQQSKKQKSNNSQLSFKNFTDNNEEIFIQDIQSIQEEFNSQPTHSQQQNQDEQMQEEQTQQQQFFSQQHEQQYANDFNSVAFLSNFKQNNKQHFNNFLNNIKQPQQQQIQQKDPLSLFKLKYDNKPRQDPQLIHEFRDTALSYLQKIERDYIPKFQQISPIRASVIDWLVDVSCKLRLKCETLHIAVQVYDRYLGEKQDGSSMTQQVHHLIAGTALFMIAKYEEIYPPPLSKFSECLQFHSGDIIKMEGKILNKIGFTLTFPTSLKFLEGYALYEESLDSNQLNLAKFLIQLALHDPNLYNYENSRLASSALLVSMKLKNMDAATLWSQPLQKITGFVQDDLEDLANKLFLLLLSIQTSHGSAVYIKFAQKKFDYIAMNCQLQQTNNNSNNNNSQVQQSQ